MSGIICICGFKKKNAENQKKCLNALTTVSCLLITFLIQLYHGVVCDRGLRLPEEKMTFRVLFLSCPPGLMNQIRENGTLGLFLNGILVYVGV